MTQTLQQGDQVEWQAGQGTTTGVVQKQITESTEVEGQTVAASQDDLRYLVKNDSTGKVTGHKPESLTQIRGDEGSSASEQEEKVTEFETVVNMTAHELENWLDTEESKSVGQENETGEIKGRQSGKHIIEILSKNKTDYTEDDYQRMQKVVSYVHRHAAQQPSGDIENTPWRYSLMNWGHDPLKD